MARVVSTYYATTIALANTSNNMQRDSTTYCYNRHMKSSSKSDGSESDGSKSDGSKSDGSKSDGSKSDGSKSDGSKSDGSKSDGSKSDGSKSDGSKSDGSTRPRSRSTSYCHRPLPPLPKMKRRYSVRVPPSKRQLAHFSTYLPTLYPKEKVDPLSLQDNSFLNILSRVDQYPPELLGKLPLAWRRKLLSALPLFRLYQLEKSSVGEGIDIDEIWEEHSKLKNSVWSSYMKDGQTKRHSIHTLPSTSDFWDKLHSYVPDQHSHRAKFIDYLSHLLFNEMNRDYACKRITELLHATHVETLDKTVANALIYGHINSLFMFIPPYCLVPFRCPNLTERELYWSLYGNGMQPTSVEIYVNNLDASPLWNQEIISQVMMSRMLSKLRLLRIYNQNIRTDQLEKLANAVTHSSKYKDPPSSMGSLKHLEILKTDDEHLVAIIPYFAAPNGYSNLTSLTISMKPLRYVQASIHLGPIIKNQLNSLQHFHLQGLFCCVTRNVIHKWDLMFFNILSSFILKQRFCNLVLSQFKQLPWQLLRKLLEANLRTVPSHKQSLIFRDGTITRKGEIPFSDTKHAGENQFYPAAESKCLEHKCIHFDKTTLPMDVLEWFERTDRLCIHTLEFNKVIINHTTIFFPNSINKYITGMNGVEYAQHMENVKITNKSLRNIFVNHKNFECQVFKWTDVNTEFNTLNV